VRNSNHATAMSVVLLAKSPPPIAAFCPSEGQVAYATFNLPWGRRYALVVVLGRKRRARRIEDRYLNQSVHFLTAINDQFSSGVDSGCRGASRMAAAGAAAGKAVLVQCGHSQRGALAHGDRGTPSGDALRQANQLQLHRVRVRHQLCKRMRGAVEVNCSQRRSNARTADRVPEKCHHRQGTGGTQAPGAGNKVEEDDGS
jgi:hypothetical protein